MRSSLIAILVLSSQSLIHGTALAVPADLIANGNFENNGGLGQINGTISSLSNWSVQVLTDPIGEGFAFIMNNTADSTGSPSVSSPPNLSLWGPNNGVNNGFTISPQGGDFLALNNRYSRVRISQTVNGLTIGARYEVSFYWAIAQSTGTSGAYTGGWAVNFGSQGMSLSSATIPSQGFRGWEYATLPITATSSSQILSFEAGLSDSLGIYTLFDGMTLNAVTVPEPSTYLMGTMAILVLGWISRKKRNNAASRETA